MVAKIIAFKDKASTKVNLRQFTTSSATKVVVQRRPISIPTTAIRWATLLRY